MIKAMMRTHVSSTKIHDVLLSTKAFGKSVIIYAIQQQPIRRKVRMERVLFTEMFAAIICDNQIKKCNFFLKKCFEINLFKPICKISQHKDGYEVNYHLLLVNVGQISYIAPIFYSSVVYKHHNFKIEKS